jgi:PAS domain S-box-containing protein
MNADDLPGSVVEAGQAECLSESARRVDRQYANIAAVLGCAPSEVPACSPAELPWIHPDDRVRVADAWRAHLEGSVGRYECTHRTVDAAGTVRWIRQRGRAVEFEAGRPTRLVGTIADVTEQQAAEERLRNAQKLEMLGLLAGGFAHDLNTFLVAIRGHAALAATEPGISPSALESLASVQLATTKAKLLTTNMLSLGRPSAERIVRFPLRHAIEETLELARPGFPRTVGISVDLGPADGLELELDPISFQQAILNLLIGTLAGAINVCFVQPLWVANSRMKLQGTSSAADQSQSSNTFQVILRIYREEVRSHMPII